MLNVNLQHIKFQFFFSPETVEKIKFCPSLSARNRETMKVVSRLCFIWIRETCLPVDMQNTIGYKHRQVFADFLQRNPRLGWASEAKPIPTQIQELPQTAKTAYT